MDDEKLEQELTDDEKLKQDLIKVLNEQVPKNIKGRDRAEYVASGLAINEYLALGEDFTVGDLDDIFRRLFREGVEFARAEMRGKEEKAQ